MGQAVRSPIFWCVLLVAACIVAPYLFRVPPRRHRDWVLLTAAIAFLLWLLGGFTFVRALMSSSPITEAA